MVDDAQDARVGFILTLLVFSRHYDAVDIQLTLSKFIYYGFNPNTVKWFTISAVVLSECRCAIRLDLLCHLVLPLLPKGFVKGLSSDLFYLFCTLEIL